MNRLSTWDEESKDKSLDFPVGPNGFRQNKVFSVDVRVSGCHD